MAYLTRTLSPEETNLLRRYRRAAGLIYERLTPYAAQQFQVNLFGSDGAGRDDLIPTGDFVALLSSFRKVQATKEPITFRRIANLAHSVGNQEIQRLVSEVREGWEEAFKVPLVFDLHGEHFTPRAILHTWMNGEEFHQDEALEARVDLLRSAGSMTQVVMQFCVHRACFTVLGLDNVCALLLGEPLREVPNPFPPDTAGTA